jgi:hypothetical protein
MAGLAAAHAAPATPPAMSAAAMKPPARRCLPLTIVGALRWVQCITESISLSETFNERQSRTTAHAQPQSANTVVRLLRSSTHLQLRSGACTANVNQRRGRARLFASILYAKWGDVIFSAIDVYHYLHLQHSA